jgi:alpha-galactosidase
MPHLTFHPRSRIFALIVLSGLLCSLPARVSAEDRSTMLTPAAPAYPRINGPRLYGARPGREFLYRIPCTGVRPIRFSAKGLPPALRLDPDTGIISGHVPKTRGEYPVTLSASNAKGAAKLVFKIVVGDRIGLTPQMGWNDWYTHIDRVTDKDIRTAADQMIASGMADYGYQFISIDDAWATKPGSTDPQLNGEARNASGAILPNRRFPDMAALTAYVHSKGLKAGIYTSPGPRTCANFEGSYGHESEDANQFKKWGFDLLKYDYCSYKKLVPHPTLEQFQAPYRKMGGILNTIDRDIVFNMCQYGLDDVWKWGKEVGGNSWRTTNDVGVLGDKTLPAFYEGGLENAAHSKYAGPGGWNDPDYILIGTIGNLRDSSAAPQSARLTLDEQYSYMSMWSLMASPLFFSGDMARLDAQTLNVLCNSEVIDVDQDPLGKQGGVIRRTREEFILVKPLEGGSVAVGLFNLTSSAHSISISRSDLGVRGSKRIRDLWRQKDIGLLKDTFTSDVPAHGVSLVRIATNR